MGDLFVGRGAFDEAVDWIYIPPLHIRNYIFFRGIYQFWQVYILIIINFNFMI